MLPLLTRLIRLGLLPIVVLRKAWDDPFDDPDPYLSESTSSTAW
jgi:hypothetical protein